MSTAIDTVMAFRQLGIDIPTPSENAKARTAENKRLLLELAENGRLKPSQRKDKLGWALCNYISRSSKTYDEVFDKEIRELRPDWFTTPSDVAGGRKRQLLEMARAGKPRPIARKHKQGVLLGNILPNYTNKSSASYDEAFDKQIRLLAPQWFIDRSSITRDKKKRLLEMARARKPRPNQKKDKLGQSLCAYTYKSSGCYDADFDKEIRGINSDWFIIDRYGAADTKKARLLEMARAGEPKPTWRDEMGRFFCNYTQKLSNSYDEAFDRQIRLLAPQWFRISRQIAKVA